MVGRISAAEMTCAMVPATGQSAAITRAVPTGHVADSRVAAFTRAALRQSASGLHISPLQTCRSASRHQRTQYETAVDINAAA